LEDRTLVFLISTYWNQATELLKKRFSFKPISFTSNTNIVILTNKLNELNIGTENDFEYVKNSWDFYRVYWGFNFLGLSPVMQADGKIVQEVERLKNEVDSKAKSNFLNGF
jgi:hypothetical protein